MLRVLSRSVSRPAGLPLAVAVLLMAFALPVKADAPLELGQATEMALERDSTIKGLNVRSEGLRERAVADGALPDPEIVIGAEGLPVDNPVSSDMMTMYRVGVRQRFPAGDSRRLSREQTRFLAAATDHEARARAEEVTLQVRRAWLDWKLATQVLELTRSAEEAFAELVEVTESRYRSGQGRQMDISQARLERARLEQRILSKQAEAEAARTALVRWTGEFPSGTGGPGNFPEWPEPGSRLAMLERIGKHPAVRADDERTEAGRIETSLARQAYRPEWMVEAGYGHQRGSDPMGGRMSDKLFAMVSFNLPVFTGNRQDRQVASARAELEALDHDRGARLQEYEGRMDRANSDWNRFGQMLELYDNHLLPEADRAFESTLSAYQSGRASFDELIRTRLDRLDQRIGRLEAWRTRQAARIELAYLAGDAS